MSLNRKDFLLELYAKKVKAYRQILIKLTQKYGTNLVSEKLYLAIHSSADKIIAPDPEYNDLFRRAVKLCFECQTYEDSARENGATEREIFKINIL